MRGLLLATILSLALAPCGASASEADGVSREYALKAAYLCRFADYVDWPESAFKSADEPMVLGVLGESPFGTALDKLVAGTKSHGRELTVKYFHTLDEYQPCHLLFICSSETERLKDILSKTRDAPVLVVGDSPGLAEKGAAIDFLIEDNKVRFEVNPEAAKQARLQISSKLLHLAKLAGGGQ